MKQNRIKKRIINFLLIISIIGLAISSILPEASAEPGLQIYPSSGPEGTQIEVYIDIKTTRDPSEWSYYEEWWYEYIGLDYVIVWSFDSGEQSNPEYWNIIGTATIDGAGNLEGTATIPTVYAYTDYTIAAAYRYADQSWKEWFEGTFTVTPGGSGGGNNNNNNDDDWPCIIATATYGGPYEPEVSFMRHVRDDLIGSNSIGQQLVKAWNSFYYSWSPPVASTIAKSNILKTTSSFLLLPLLGITHLSEIQYYSLSWFSPELASISAFLMAAILSMLTYIALPMVIAVFIIKHRSSLHKKIKRKNG